MEIKDQLKTIRSVADNIPRVFALLWDADRRGTLIMGGLMFVGALLPTSQAWVAKLIIDSVVHLSAQSRLSISEKFYLALPYILIEFGLILTSTVLTQLRRLNEEVINYRLGYAINRKIINKALTLDLVFFENADFFDRMQKARQESEYRALAIVTGGFLLIQNFITLASFLALLLAFKPLLALLLFGATVPVFFVQNHYSRLRFRLQSWRTPETRRMSYFEQILTGDRFVKEIKLFRLGKHLLERYDKLFWKVLAEDEKLAWRRSVAALFWGTLALITYYFSYAWIVMLTIAGTIGLGDMTLYLTVFRQTQATFQGLFDNLNRLYENGLFMDNLFGFFAIQAISTGPNTPISAPASILREGIELRNVSFRYPSSDPHSPWVLREVNLKIHPQEKIALVGENGAGKTTLIKLLTRLYEPTEGEIYFNGRNLASYNVEELHAKIGVIFQDFVQYLLSVRDNIGFGSIDDLADTDKILRAAQKSGADQIIDQLPKGVETQLGKWFENGHELSGGQWQKIALGRAFMPNAEVLVLDEPTAALDAEREFEIFNRFNELTKGKIAVIISHRFSTVRMANQIVVLKDGRIAEMGSHAALLETKGIYARLFSLQARGFQ